MCTVQYIRIQHRNMPACVCIKLYQPCFFSFEMALWHSHWPHHSKGTFTNHLVCQHCVPWISCTDTDCHKLRRQPMSTLHSCPGHCVIGPIYRTNPPWFSSCLSSSHIHLSAAAKFHSVHWMAVNRLFNLLLGCNWPCSISIVLQNMVAFTVQQCVWHA